MSRAERSNDYPSARPCDRVEPSRQEATRINVRQIIALLLVAASAPLAIAGTPSSPEITDASGDAAEAHLDVTRAWVTNDHDSVQINVQVRAISDPINAGDLRALYRAQFSLATLADPVVVDGEVHLTAVPGSAISIGAFRVGAGTTGTGTIRPTVTVDAAAGVVTLDVPRAYNVGGSGPQYMTSGTVLSGLTVSTAAGENPVMGNTPQAQALVGAPWRFVDATGSASYVVQ